MRNEAALRVLRPLFKGAEVTQCKLVHNEDSDCQFYYSVCPQEPCVLDYQDPVSSTMEFGIPCLLPRSLLGDQRILSRKPPFFFIEIFLLFDALQKSKCLLEDNAETASRWASTLEGMQSSFRRSVCRVKLLCYNYSVMVMGLTVP